LCVGGPPYAVIAGRIAGAVITGFGLADAVALGAALALAVALGAALGVVSTTIGADTDAGALGAVVMAASCASTGVSLLHPDAAIAKRAARDARTITLERAAKTRAPQNGHASPRT